jgi:hypothetical protein
MRTRGRTAAGKGTGKAPAAGKGKGKGKAPARASPIRKSKRKAAAQGQRRAPKKRAPVESDDETVEGSGAEEEAPAAAPAAPAAAPAAAAPRPPKPSLPSVASLAGLSRADAKLPSRKKALAALHHLAGQLLAQDMEKEAGIVAAAAFTASEMMNELAEARAR